MQSEWGGKRPLAEAGRLWHGLDWPALSEDFFLLNNFQKLFLHSTTEQQGLHRPWGGGGGWGGLETSVQDGFLD